jgi:hypothetical protein
VAGQGLAEGKNAAETRDIGKPLHARKVASVEVADFTVRENCYKLTIPVQFSHQAGNMDEK